MADHSPEKCRISQQIAPPLVRLLHQQLHPFISKTAHPVRRSLKIAGPMVEQSAGAETQWYAQLFEMPIDPLFLRDLAAELDRANRTG